MDKAYPQHKDLLFLISLLSEDLSSYETVRLHIQVNSPPKLGQGDS